MGNYFSCYMLSQSLVSRIDRNQPLLRPLHATSTVQTDCMKDMQHLFHCGMHIVSVANVTSVECIGVK